ncbi:MAG: asparagine synthase (glutamine-hydrolyzing), partial [Deltaproteobacteria bacterium]
MCGIAGRVARDREATIDRRTLERMGELLAHRGPDGEGIHASGPVGLVHRRLAIVDIEGGAQPMSNEDGKVWIVFNGEIYNHDALRAELLSHGHVFKTRSDTETIIHGYEQWGAAVTDRLLGMFAFAIWDERAPSLLLARDRLGIKPLYYAASNGDLVFGSEIKALLCHPDIAREADPEGLLAYLTHRYVPGPRTALRGIYKLQPGHRLTWRDGRVDLARYWDVPTGGGTTRDPDAGAQQLLSLFQDAVKKRLMGEVPVGLFLSGGIDSSAVAWAMAQANEGAKLRSYAVGFPGEGEGGELGFARLAAKAVGTEHREVLLTHQAFEAFLPRLVWHLDEPIADSACVPLFYLAEAAKSEVTVVLSGEGADELLAGYPIHWKMLALERAHRSIGGLGSAALREAARRIPHPKLAKYLGWAADPLERRYRGVSVALPDEERRRLLGTGARSADAEAEWAAVWAASAGRSPLSRILYADTKVWLPDDLLVKADKMTMASGIELRVPFLDHRLVELCAGLPDELKLRGRTGKWLLRHALRGELPEPILTRPKRGFPVPFSAWLRGPLHASLRERLLAKDSVCSAFDQKYLGQMLDEQRSGTRDRGEALWALLVYDMWHERFVRDSSWRKPWKPTSRNEVSRNGRAQRPSMDATSSASPTIGTETPS